MKHFYVSSHDGHNDVSGGYADRAATIFARKQRAASQWLPAASWRFAPGYRDARPANAARSRPEVPCGCKKWWN